MGLKHKKATVMTDIEAATMTGDMVKIAMRTMLIKYGASLEAVLSGAHAQIVAEMVAAIGGPAAYERFMQAAENIRHMPSASELALVSTPAVGSA